MILSGFDGEHLLTLPVTHLDVRTDRVDLNVYNTILRDCPDLIHLSVLRPQVSNIVAIESSTNKDKKGKGKKTINNSHYDGIIHSADKGREKDKNKIKNKEDDNHDDEGEKENDLNIINAEGFAVLLKQHGRNLKSFEISNNMPRWTTILTTSLPKSLETLVIHSNQLENKMAKAITSYRSTLTTLVLDLGSGLSRKGRLSGVRRAVRDCYALRQLEVHDHSNDNLLQRNLLRKLWATFNIETVAFHGVRGWEKPAMMQVMPPAVRAAGWNKVFTGKNDKDAEPESVEEVITVPPVQAPGQLPHQPTGPRHLFVDFRTLEHLQQFPRLREVIITDTLPSHC
ncbi:hypothetical protein BGZ47_003684 [Haplosporangium gracile]|nr:hypothetical protein BGZ47_003684 [Haplosporangium gracile]